MGDRANIKIVEEDGGVIYFYTHWSGSRLPITLQEALKRGRDRWTDGQYLSRIIFSEMIKDEVLDITGYGISTVVGDGDDRIIIVNLKNQSILLNDNNFAFDEFTKLTEEELVKIYEKGR